jgi:DNA-binding PadR family transcriptional regulator
MPREALKTLSESMYYVLLSLTEERCGIEIMSKVFEISGGRVQIGPGTLYTMLSKFESNKMIRCVSAEPKRKNYIITPYGSGMLKEEYERIARLASDGRRIVEELDGQRNA